MNIEEARLYLEHTSKEDFNLEEWQKENRYQALQVVLKEIERLNNIINELEKELKKDYDIYVSKNRLYGTTYKAGANTYREHILYKLKELKGDSSNE